MKKQLLFLFILLTGGIFAQQPEFSFKLYFEDAMGNKDTVTLGYDANATDSIDAAFGEVNLINQPWSDDDFEIRVSDIAQLYGDIGNFLTKKNIVKNNCGADWFLQPKISLGIKNAHYPIQLSWNQNAFTGACANVAFLVDLIPDLWFDAGGPAIDWLSNTNNPEITIGQPSQITYDGTLNNDENVYYFWFSFMDQEQTDSMNYFFTHLAVNEFKTQVTESVYPNPFNDGVTIPSEQSPSKIKLRDMQGKEIKFEQYENTVYPINCTKGLYFLSFESNGEWVHYKIIKE